MSETIQDVKNTIRAFLRADFNPVPPKTRSSQKKHLEVWITRQDRRALGLEMDHDEVVNFWVTSVNIPPADTETITVVRKTPNGSKWTDANGDGANSNLSSYDEFRTKPIARLGVTRRADAELILRHLSR